MGHTFVGMVPDLTGVTNRGRMLLVTLDAVNDVHLFRMTPAGVATELTGPGTRPQGDTVFCVPTTAYQNGFQLIACGLPATNYSIASYDGGGSFTRVAPTTSLKGQYLAAASGHFLLASVDFNAFDGRHTVQIADTLIPTVWDPSIANSADVVTVSGSGAIVGMVPVLGGVIVLTTRQALAFTSTGSIPPFTVQIVAERGTERLNSQLIAATPYGPAFEGPDDYYVVGGSGFGRKVFSYIKTQSDAGATMAKLLWHHGIGCLVRGISGVTSESLLFDPATQAWWRRTLPSGGFHDVSHGESTLAGIVPSEHWIGGSGAVIYKEDTTGASVFTGAFVDSKDFAFESPSSDDYIDRVKVDWECLSSATTDALEVLAWVRNDLAPGRLGLDSFNITPTMVSLGTLAAGDSELFVRQRGKFARFRFKQSSGRARVRGFAIRRQRASDRKT